MDILLEAMKVSGVREGEAEDTGGGRGRGGVKETREGTAERRRRSFNFPGFL